VATLSVKERHGLPETVDSPTIVTLRLVGQAKALACQHVQDGISASRGKREGALVKGHGLVIHAPEEEMD
jgi:hypothetical protein